MPVTYAIDVRKALIVTRCVGPVTLREVQEHFQELTCVWPPIQRLDVLLDLTDQTSLPTLRDLEEAAAELDQQIGPKQFGRCAVVTGLQLHGAMQMFEVLVGRFFDAFEIFPSPEAAIVWLAPTTPKARLFLSPH